MSLTAQQALEHVKKTGYWDMECMIAVTEASQAAMPSLPKQESSNKTLCCVSGCEDTVATRANQNVYEMHRLLPTCGDDRRSRARCETLSENSTICGEHQISARRSALYYAGKDVEGVNPELALEYARIARTATFAPVDCSNPSLTRDWAAFLVKELEKIKDKAKTPAQKKMLSAQVSWLTDFPTAVEKLSSSQAGAAFTNAPTFRTPMPTVPDIEATITHQTRMPDRSSWGDARIIYPAGEAGVPYDVVPTSSTFGSDADRR